MNRRRLPDTRESVKHEFNIGGVAGSIVAGLYEDGSLGEVFIHIDKEGTALSGAYDSWATVLSISLQYGVPLKAIISKGLFSRFEPQGMTDNQGEIPIATSIVDYVCRWLGARYLTAEERKEINFPTEEDIIQQRKLRG